MSAKQPLWLQAVQRLERAIGEPVEAAVRSDTYFDLVAKTTRARATVKGVAEGASRKWLHLFNLPAGSDVRRMREQLTRVERRLSQLTEEVAELDGSPRHRRRTD
jgi:hypothetical protein